MSNLGIMVSGARLHGQKCANLPTDATLGTARHQALGCRVRQSTTQPGLRRTYTTLQVGKIDGVIMRDLKHLNLIG